MIDSHEIKIVCSAYACNIVILVTRKNLRVKVLFQLCIKPDLLNSKDLTSAYEIEKNRN